MGATYLILSASRRRRRGGYSGPPQPVSGLMVLCFFLFTAILFVVALQSDTDSQYKLSHWPRANATVGEKISSKKSALTYVTRDGQRVDTEISGRHDPGEVVEVLYNPTEVSDFYLVQSAKDSGFIYLLPLITLIITIFLLYCQLTGVKI